MTMKITSLILIETLFRKLLLYPTELRGLKYLPHNLLYSFSTINHVSSLRVIVCNHRLSSMIMPVPLGKAWDELNLKYLYDFSPLSLHWLKEKMASAGAFGVRLFAVRLMAGLLALVQKMVVRIHHREPRIRFQH